MIRFCLDSSVLGTEEHLFIDDGTFSWMKYIPSEAWHLSGAIKEDSDWCLDTALRLSGNALDLRPPERFVKAMSTFSGSMGDSTVPWAKVLPGKEHQGFTKRLVEEVTVAMAGAPLDYYRTVWVPGNAVLRSLERVEVDLAGWAALEQAGEGNVAAIRSFKPTANGLAMRVHYDRFKTLTGRLTVESGPQILTLKREHRKIIKSIHGDHGGIYALDFAALEARILLYEYGRKCDDPDLYGMIARELGKDRKAIKGAVISELYGSSKWALGKHLGIEGRELDTFVKNVRAYFKTDELLKRVKAQYVATDKVINRYGRPISIDEPIDRIFVSYYGQSTGVDVTMLGFNQVIETLRKKAPKTRPVFLLHDAIFLDVPNDELAEVQKIKHVKVKGYVQKFPLKLEKIG